ncbi:response regulator [Geobacter sp. FeAm09]|uniref:response regulator n=1 Tax=Geobacter sp. FeAm09 TaxID=2597769 RepID=UPI0011EFA32B|nr:response regulator [Geobacter sp. FeAm09]QEM70010.1 response regulator [Geobacter sp. FeAm09]
MAEHILIVEDELKLVDILRGYLHMAGFETSSLCDGTEVVPWVKYNEPDLILLDVVLPGRDGLDICKEIRIFSPVPIIMMSARIDEIDRLLGLELGADDYVCKPFSPREVVARVKAVLRRMGDEQATRIAGLTLDESRYRATLAERELDLTAVEFKLLQLLATKPGRIYSRQQLMEKIYPDRRVVSNRTIDSHIKKLRKKMANVKPEQEFIHSVYGAGYKFEVA